LHTVIASVRYVHIAVAINGDPVWCSELSIAGSFHSYGADESASRGKLLDTSVTSVLQTTAGKMIFGRFDERQHAVHEKDRPERPPREHAPAPAAGS